MWNTFRVSWDWSSSSTNIRWVMLSSSFTRSSYFWRAGWLANLSLLVANITSIMYCTRTLTLPSWSVLFRLSDTGHSPWGANSVNFFHILWRSWRPLPRNQGWGPPRAMSRFQKQVVCAAPTSWPSEQWISLRRGRRFCCCTWMYVRVLEPIGCQSAPQFGGLSVDSGNQFHINMSEHGQCCLCCDHEQCSLGRTHEWFQQCFPHWPCDRKERREDYRTSVTYMCVIRRICTVKCVVYTSDIWNLLFYK